MRNISLHAVCHIELLMQNAREFIIKYDKHKNIPLTDQERTWKVMSRRMNGTPELLLGHDTRTFNYTLLLNTLNGCVMLTNYRKNKPLVGMNGSEVFEFGSYAEYCHEVPEQIRTVATRQVQMWMKLTTDVSRSVNDIDCFNWIM